MVKTVYVVLLGGDCEGGTIQKVFANKADALLYIDKNYSGLTKTGHDEWHTTFLYNGKRLTSCDYVCIEECEVE